MQLKLPETAFVSEGAHRWSGATSLVPPSNKVCDNSIILFSFSKCCGDVDPLFLCLDQHTDQVCHGSIAIAFFPEGDTRFYRATQDPMLPSGSH